MADEAAAAGEVITVERMETGAPCSSDVETSFTLTMG